MKRLIRISPFFVILLLFGCSHSSNTPDILIKQKSDKPLETYKWATYSLKNIHALKDVGLTLKGNGLVHKYDSTFEVLALDTTPMLLQIKSADIDRTDTLTAGQNPNFNPAWKDLDFGVTPTPLTKAEYRTFGVFAKYRLINKPFSLFEIKSTDGFLLDNTSLKGKVTVLNFWYAGCLPCESEMPALNILKKKYSDDPDVQLFSLFRDSIYVRPDGELRFQAPSVVTSDGPTPFRKYNFTWKQFPNALRQNRVFNIFGFPTNLIVDKNGIIRMIYVGASASGDNRELIERISDEIERLKKG